MSIDRNRNVYVGHRYVPLIDDEWDQNKSYEGLTVVTHKGGSYTSKKRVPVGIDIDDKEFWAFTGNYNAQIEEYRKDVRKVEDKLTENEKKVTAIDKKIVANINDYPRISPEATDDGRFARAKADIGKGTLILNAERYTVTDDIELHGYYGIVGVYANTVIEKVGGTSKHIFKVKETQNGEFWIQLANMDLEYYGTETGVKAIHLAHSSQVDIHNVYIKGNFEKAMYADILWLANISNVTAWCHNDKGYLAYDFRDGTSINLSTVWSKNFARGFNLGSAMYSSLNSCAVDTFSVYAYDGGQGVSYNGCGAEDGRLVDGGFVYGNTYRSATLSGCQIYNIGTAVGTEKGKTSIFKANGPRMKIEGFRAQEPLRTDGMIDLIHALSDAKVTIENSQLPTNVNQKVVMNHDWGEVVIKEGYREEVYRNNRDKNITTDLDKEFSNGYKKSGDNLLIGKPFNHNTTFKAVKNTHKNSYSITTMDEPNGIKEILSCKTDIAGNYLIFASLDILVSSYSGNLAEVNPTKLVINARIANGSSKKVEEPSVLSGIEDHGVTVEWVDDKLVVKLNKEYAKCFIEATVFQVESSGSANLSWL